MKDATTGSTELEKNKYSPFYILPPFFVLLILLTCLFQETVKSQPWRLVGPNATAITSDANDGSTIAISNRIYGNLFISRDGGADWMNKGAQIHNEIPYQLISDSQLLYCSTDSNIYESKDEGESWSSILFNLPPATAKLIKIVDHRLFAVGIGHLYYKDENADEWNLGFDYSSIGEYPTAWYLLTRHDTLFFNLTTYNYPFNLQSIYFSVNNGTSWNLFTYGEGGLFFPAIPGFATYYDSLFYYSLTGRNYVGKYDWEHFTYYYEEVPYLYVSYDSGGYKQGVIRYDTLGNQKWIDQTLNERGAVVYFLKIGSKLLEYKNFHFYTSTDEGDSWTDEHEQGLYGLTARFFLTSGDTFFVGTNAGLFTSANNGITWDLLTPDSLPNYMQGYSPGNSLDYGNSESIDFPLDMVNAHDTLFLASRLLGIFYSADEGLSWHGGGFNDSISTLISCIYHGELNYYNNNRKYVSPLFAGVQRYGSGSIAGLYIRGINRGTWSKFTDYSWLGIYTYIGGIYFSKFPQYADYSLIVGQRLSTPLGIPSIPYTGISFFIDSVSSYYICAQEGIFKYLWSPQNDIYPRYTITDVSNNLQDFDPLFLSSKWVNGGFAINNRIFIGTNNGIYAADTSDFQWEDKSYNLQDRNTSRLSYNNGKIYALTGQGVFAIDEIATGIPATTKSTLSFSIYPNPASNNECFVSLQAASSSKHYSIIIKNLLGQDIFKGILEKGVNEIKLPQAIHSGFYLFRLFADGSPVEEKKWALIR